MLQLKFSDEPGHQWKRWKSYAQIVWESEHGPMPKGHIVVFKERRAAHHRSGSDQLRKAATEVLDRLRGHPAYADLTEAEEIEVGGDTAELSYLARVLDAAMREEGGG